MTDMITEIKLNLNTDSRLFDQFQLVEGLRLLQKLTLISLNDLNDAAFFFGSLGEIVKGLQYLKSLTLDFSNIFYVSDSYITCLKELLKRVSLKSLRVDYSYSDSVSKETVAKLYEVFKDPINTFHSTCSSIGFYQHY